jgi:hypothetical protein
MANMPVVPEKLYKYRGIDIYTERMLARQEFYFAGPELFNDPFDCRVTFSTECSESDFRQMVKDDHLHLKLILASRYPTMSFDDAVSLGYRERNLLIPNSAKGPLDADRRVLHDGMPRQYFDVVALCQQPQRHLLGICNCR